MSHTWNPDELLAACSTTKRHTEAVALDLLTEPAWGPWEGVAEYDDLAPLIASRGCVPVLHVARPGRVARVAAWCLGVVLVLCVVGGVAQALGWM